MAGRCRTTAAHIASRQARRTSPRTTAAPSKPAGPLRPHDPAARRLSAAAQPRPYRQSTRRRQVSSANRILPLRAGRRARHPLRLVAAKPAGILRAGLPRRPHHSKRSSQTMAASARPTIDAHPPSRQGQQAHQGRQPGTTRRRRPPNVIIESAAGGKEPHRHRHRLNPVSNSRWERTDCKGPQTVPRQHL